MLTIIGEFGGKLALNLRCERPIEGCELTPNAFLQIKGGSVDNATRAKILDPSNYYYVYCWRRGPKSAPCGNSQCPRGMSYEPIRWSKAALGGPELVCNVCTSNGFPAHESSFCSKE